MSHRPDPVSDQDRQALDADAEGNDGHSTRSESTTMIKAIYRYQSRLEYITEIHKTKE
jgi:hypothetical protein